MPVYAIQEGGGGPVKIGWSNDPEIRLAQLQGMNPRGLRLVHRFFVKKAVEKMLHEHFAAHRMSGEWFAVTPNEVREVAHDIFCNRADLRAPEDIPAKVRATWDHPITGKPLCPARTPSQSEPV